MENTVKKAADTVKHALTCKGYAEQKMNQWGEKFDDIVNGRPRVQEIDDFQGKNLNFYDFLIEIDIY